MSNASVVTGCCECHIVLSVDDFGPLRGSFKFLQQNAPCAVAIRSGSTPTLRYLGTEQPVSVVLEHRGTFIFEQWELDETARPQPARTPVE